MPGAERDGRAPAARAGGAPPIESDDPALERYLTHVAAALHAIPPAEREEILLETRSHVVEQARRTPSGRAEGVLARLGAPEHYARQFLAESVAEAPPADAPPRARARGRGTGSVTLRGFAALASGAAGWWWRGPLLALVLAAYGVAGCAFLLLCAELTDPPGTGVFVRPNGDGNYSIAVLLSDPAPPGTTDLLGGWLAPLLLTAIAAVVFGVRALLRRVLRDDAPRG
jgi:uncharacterized membrane protein